MTLDREVDGMAGKAKSKLPGLEYLELGPHKFRALVDDIHNEESDDYEENLDARVKKALELVDTYKNHKGMFDEELTKGLKEIDLSQFDKMGDKLHSNYVGKKKEPSDKVAESYMKDIVKIVMPALFNTKSDKDDDQAWKDFKMYAQTVHGNDFQGWMSGVKQDLKNAKAKDAYHKIADTMKKYSSISYQQEIFGSLPIEDTEFDKALSSEFAGRYSDAHGGQKEVDTDTILGSVKEYFNVYAQKGGDYLLQVLHQKAKDAKPDEHATGGH